MTVQYSRIGLIRDLYNSLKFVMLSLEKDFLIRPTLEFAFEIILFICIRNSNEGSKCTPTSFSRSSLARSMLPMVYVCFGLLLP